MSTPALEPWMAEMLLDLEDWIRIPSIASDPDGRPAMLEGAQWTADRLGRFCDDVEFVDLGGPGPLVIGRIRASGDVDFPRTYLVYGHYDVQPAGDGWTHDAFQPLIRDGWLLGRGSSDDKGQFLALIKGIEMLVKARRLPVNVVFLADSCEETLGTESSHWLREKAAGLDGAVLFDSSFLDERTPVINIATRGLVKFRIDCRTGERDLHSGLAGGAARNALHELVRFVDAILPTDGRLPAPLMEGAIPPSPDEEEGWRQLPHGADLLSSQGGRPADASAADEYYLRTWARPSLDLHGFSTDGSDGIRTAVISHASVDASIRLAPGQRPEIASTFLAEQVETANRATPEANFTLTIESTTSPAFSSQDSPLLRAGARAFEQIWGTAPRFLRAGGTLPFVATLSELGVPFLLSGLHLPEGNAHGPDEKILLRHLFDGTRLVCVLFSELAADNPLAPEPTEGVTDDH